MKAGFRVRRNITPAARSICAHLPSSRMARLMAEFPCAALPPRHFPKNLISGNLSKNPVNLSIFIEIFGYKTRPGRVSLFSKEPRGSAIIRGFFLRPLTASAGNCAPDAAAKLDSDWRSRGCNAPGRGHHMARQPLRIPPCDSSRRTANAGKCGSRRDVVRPGKIHPDRRGDVDKAPLTENPYRINPPWPLCRG